MGLAQRLKKLRIKKGFPQEKTARSSDIALSYYRALEKGRSINPTLDILIKLADTLEISLDELAGRKFPK